jgi:hypothetical protein
MSVRRFLLVLPPLAALIAGCAAAPGASPESATSPTRARAPERQCFSPHQVDNFRTGEPQTLYLRARGAGVYRLTTAGACSDLETAYGLAVAPEMGASRLCTEEWVTVTVPGSAAAVQTCRARIDRRLTEAEVAALPARYRP